jgi:hypothetical protein
MKNKFLHRSIIVTFVSLYLLVSVISTIHVIDFFQLSNPYWLAVSLAIGFELGAAASLASLVILDKMNRTLVWILFGAITLMQMQGNMYHAFSHMENFQGWSELFGLIEEDVIYQKRILAAVSGAILPLVALGFIKSLIDYIKPENNSKEEEIKEEPIITPGPIEEILEDEKESLIEEYIPSDNEYIEGGNSSSIDLVDEIPEEAIEYLMKEKIEKPIENRGIQIEENNLLPVNSNKKISPSVNVNINPLLL